MGRELKRVPLDFAWPLGKRWSGYINPCPPRQCRKCDGSGYNETTKHLSDDWYNFSNHNGQEGWQYHLEQDEVDALLNRGRLMDFTHEPRNLWQAWVVDQKLVSGRNSWLPFPNGYHPTAKEVNAWARQGFGHDALNRSICVETRAKRLGVWGLCDHCNGEGEWFVNEQHERHYEEWEKTEPPEGPGFQLWETTSEGSPISPVFDSIDRLCDWAETNATTFGSFKTSAKEWKRMLSDGLVVHKEGQAVFL